MPTTEFQSQLNLPTGDPPGIDRSGTAGHPARAILALLSSLRLTIVLLAMSIFLVLAGTLAQIDHDVWYVVWKMFRAWWAWIDFQTFFPRSWQVPGSFPFPGGWLLGTALAVNMLAAHAVRFQVTGRGNRLWMGWALIVAGLLITYAVIQSGLDETVESELSASFCNGLWHALRATLGAAVLALCYGLALSLEPSRRAAAGWLWWFVAAIVFLLLGLVAWLFVHPEVRLDPSGLRILWQLIKGGAAGLVLWAGCQGVFGARGGMVLLHAGVGLLMFSELHTGLTANEAMMSIAEGQTVNYAEDMRLAELAIVDQSPTGHDQVTVVPAHLLAEAAREESILETDELPVALRVLKYFPNSSTRLLQPGESSLATRGLGRLRKARSRPINTGVATNQGVDLPAAYVELLSRQDHASLGTYLLSAQRNPESLKVGDRPLEISIRFKRLPKSYSIHLTDFRFDRYVGTDTPKNFSSLVRLRDPSHHVDRNVNIWMNNPLRYGGDTLYQADWDHETERGTVLQVVTNTGWMIPYVACMLVATGMLAHFGLVLVRFARRRSEEMRRQVLAAADQTAVGSGEPEGWFARWRSPTMWGPALVVGLLAGWVLGRARPAPLPPTTMRMDRFGMLPLAYQARVKPYDTLARNNLRILSGRQTYQDRGGRRQPAIRWLLDVLANTPTSHGHRVLRIDNLEVLEALGLERRAGFRYSLSDLFDSPEKREQYHHQVELASRMPEAGRTLVQNRFLDLARNVSLLMELRNAYASPELNAGTQEETRKELLRLKNTIDRLNQSAPRAIAPKMAGGNWKTLLEAELEALFNQAKEQPVNEATTSLRAILDAYAEGDHQKFNETVAVYSDIINGLAERERQYDEGLAKDSETSRSSPRKEAEKLNLKRVHFEAFFNHFNPFLLAMVLYLVAFILATTSWLGWNVALGRTAGWLLWLTLALHTFALVARIYISGRPPVTNLYSSAVFIGWSSVLFALLYERISRFGVGNLLAAAIGFPTLLIAYQLAGDGDTFRVLQAVLDTQFWLATHVVCITLGYSTTLLAGSIGILYLVAVSLLDRFDQSQRLQLVRMTYGTLCFAIFFSFVGTVLGGLWADDSWGRFWGWDPKENGALIIVLWNALVLHARWGRMIGPRGLAMLAVGGNIVTFWSWFGVNELGVGLHSYGFSEGTTFWLMLFVLSQLAIIALGLLPSGKRITG
jgi:ABC-type transport system involved in cytochrome c biogenesis permease subunit